MNTLARSKRSLPLLLTIFGQWPMLSFAAAPRLERIKARATEVWFFDFRVPRGPGIPALARLTANGAVREPNAILRFFIFGAIEGANLPETPLRWDIADPGILITTTSITAGPRTCPTLLRYPFDALVAGPDDGRVAANMNKFQDLDAYASFTNYVSCAPICGAVTGLYVNWNGKDTLSDPAKIVHYDIRALDENRVELFLTADAKLYKWLYDGKKWKNEALYPVRVDNEFLVLGDGKSLVTDQFGQWCIIRNVEDADAACEPIADRVESEPLTLVEDKVEQKNYFLHRDKFLDDRGRELWTVGDARDHNERVGRVIDFVVARRQGRP